MFKRDHQETAIFIASLVLRLTALIIVGFILRYLGDIL